MSNSSEKICSSSLIDNDNDDDDDENNKNLNVSKFKNQYIRSSSTPCNQTDNVNIEDFKSLSIDDPLMDEDLFENVFKNKFIIRYLFLVFLSILLYLMVSNQPTTTKITKTFYLFIIIYKFFLLFIIVVSSCC